MSLHIDLAFIYISCRTFVSYQLIITTVVYLSVFVISVDEPLKTSVWGIECIAQVSWNYLQLMHAVSGAAFLKQFNRHAYTVMQETASKTWWTYAKTIGRKGSWLGGGHQWVGATWTSQFIVVYTTLNIKHFPNALLPPSHPPPPPPPTLPSLHPLIKVLFCGEPFWDFILFIICCYSKFCMLRKVVTYHMCW